jgi:hypothetical protein
VGKARSAVPTRKMAAKILNHTCSVSWNESQLLQFMPSKARTHMVSVPGAVPPPTHTLPTSAAETVRLFSAE